VFDWLISDITIVVFGISSREAVVFGFHWGVFGGVALAFVRVMVGAVCKLIDSDGSGPSRSATISDSPKED